MQRISFPTKKITFDPKNKEDRLAFDLWAKLNFFTREKDKNTVCKMSVYIQAQCIKYGELKDDMLPPLLKRLEKEAISVGNIPLIRQLEHYAKHRTNSGFWFKSYYTDSITNAIKCLGKSTADKELSELIKIYLDPIDSFKKALENSPSGQLNNFELAYDLITLFGDYLTKEVLCEAFKKLVHSPNFFRCSDEVKLCVAMIEFLGINYLGKDLCISSVRKTCSFDGKEYTIASETFMETLIKKVKLQPLCFGREGLNEIYGYLTRLNEYFGCMISTRFAREMLTGIRMDYFYPATIELSFCRATDTHARSYPNPINEAAFAIFLIENYGEYLGADSIMRVYQNTTTPENLKETIQAYAQRNPQRNIRLIAPTQIPTRLVFSVATEIHKYVDKEIFKGVLKVQDILLSKCEKQAKEWIKTPRNIEEFNTLIDRLLSDSDAKKAKLALNTLIGEEEYLEKTNQLIQRNSFFVANTNIGLRKEFLSITADDRLRIWLQSSLVEASEAYQGANKMSCIKGIFERLAITGFRGMWQAIDSLMIVPEFFRFIPADSGQKDPKCELVISDDFLENLYYKIKIYNDSNKDQEKKIFLNLDKNRDFTEFEVEKLAQYSIVLFQEELRKIFYFEIKETETFLNERERNDLIQIFERILSVRYEFIKNFVNNLQYDINFIKKFTEKISKSLISK